MSAENILLTVVNIVCTFVVGSVGFFVQRAIRANDELRQTVGRLETNVAILLDRDRRRRLEDYQREDA